MSGRHPISDLTQNWSVGKLKALEERKREMVETTQLPAVYVLFRAGSNFMTELLQLCERHAGYISNITYIPRPNLVEDIDDGTD